MSYSITNQQPVPQSPFASLTLPRPVRAIVVAGHPGGLVMRLVICVLAAVLAAASAASAAPLIPDDCNPHPRHRTDCIQVATFNIEWFGSRRGTQGLRSRETVDKIADLIAVTLNLDVAVLQEIAVGEPGDPENRYEWLRQALAARHYALAAPARGPAQRIAMAWDTRDVRRTDDIDTAPLASLEVATRFDFGDGCDSAGLRAPSIASFQAGVFAFTVVGVHLKSQLGGLCADRVRFRQAGELAAALDRLAAQHPELDIVIAGDVNAQVRDPTLSPLTGNRQLWFLTAPGRFAGPADAVSYLKPPFESRIDHVVILPDRTLEFDPTSTGMVALEGDAIEDWFARISDHVPVWASFVVEAE